MRVAIRKAMSLWDTVHEDIVSTTETQTEARRREMNAARTALPGPPDYAPRPSFNGLRCPARRSCNREVDKLTPFRSDVCTAVSRALTGQAVGPDQVVNQPNSITSHLEEADQHDLTLQTRARRAPRFDHSIDWLHLGPPDALPLVGARLNSVLTSCDVLIRQDQSRLALWVLVSRPFNQPTLSPPFDSPTSPPLNTGHPGVTLVFLIFAFILVLLDLSGSHVACHPFPSRLGPHGHRPSLLDEPVQRGRPVRPGWLDG